MNPRTPRSRAPRLAAAVACAVALAAPAASAHEYWLSLARPAAEPGAAFRVSAVAGTGFRGERKPWSPGRCVRFGVRAAREFDLAPLASPGEPTWGRFTAAGDGGAMFAYESNFASIELEGGEFDVYLALEGLDGPLAARRREGRGVPGRERYRRCAKAWLPGSDASRATRSFGLPLEIVPLAIPGQAPQLKVRVLFEGRPLEGVMVKAWRAPLDPDGNPADPALRDSVAVRSRVRTGRDGTATLAVREVGEWLISAVHMVRANDAPADWESSWASLTFVVPRRHASQ